MARPPVARHLDLADAALASAPIAEPERRRMRFGPADGARTLRATADLVRASLDDALLGRASGDLLAHPERRNATLRRVPPV